jgi:hypothetical protein
VERVGEGQRRRTKAAAGLRAARGSCQSRRWHRQSGSSDERRQPTTGDEGQLGRMAEQRVTLGEGQRGNAKAVTELRGDAWSGAGAGGSLERRGTAAWGSAAARQRRNRGRRRGRGR